MPVNEEQEPLDVRMYVGMLFFRWQIIVVCLLYALLGGVLYLQWCPKVYWTGCSLMIYQDPHLTLPVRVESPTRTLSARLYLLQSGQLRARVVEKLMDKWGKIIGSRDKMMLAVSYHQTSGVAPTWQVSVNNDNTEYARDFLNTLLDEHKVEWQSMERESVGKVTQMLQDELASLEEKIRQAEDDVIEYERLHDIARTEARGAAEGGVLSGLIGKRFAINSELFMLESQFAALKGKSPEVISQFGRAAREVVAGASAKPEAREGKEPSPGEKENAKPSAETKGESSKLTEDEIARERGWQDLRLQIHALRQQEKALLENVTAENPRVQEVRSKIADLESQVTYASELALENLRDHYDTLKIILKAVEDAEYKWQAKDMLVARRRSELVRIQSIVGRYYGTHQTLYTRLFETRVAEEMKSEHYRITEPVHSSGKPSWPDPMKVMVFVLAIGLGSGFGIAVALQFLDNKIQTIKDVEKDIGVPFLGGIPFWVHSGLERTIRPIVTEEHSAGAVEAYRALRTSVLTAMNKMNERILMITSADSREGKTLTALNMAIMIAQMGKKVLLVDMDLRRGRLHRSLGLAKEPGVADALKGQLSLKEMVLKTKIENLDMIPTGSSVENASELLQATSLVAMFLDVQNDYDYIIVDTSPVLRVTDTVIMATQGVGALLYLARVNHTPKPMIRYSLDMLSEARIIGLVLNSIEMHRISSLYYAYQYPNYAYYSNAYSYGYNYYNYGDESSLRIKGRRHKRTESSGIRKWFNRTFLPMR